LVFRHDPLILLEPALDPVERITRFSGQKFHDLIHAVLGANSRSTDEMYSLANANLSFCITKNKA